MQNISLSIEQEYDLNVMLNSDKLKFKIGSIINEVRIHSN